MPMKSMRRRPKKDEMSVNNTVLTGGELKEDDGPVFPFGLRISLENESLDMLDMPTMPAVGESFMMMARVEVVRTSEEERTGDSFRSVGLQITDLSLDGEMPRREPAKILFGDQF